MRRLLSLFIVWLLLSSAHAMADRPILSLLRARAGRTVVYQSPHQGMSSYDYRRQVLNARYPRYTGAFHYSYFRDIGVPPGDVGLRGNGLYAHPW